MTEDERLQSESLEIERLLGEIQTLVTAPAWQRIEAVIGRVVRLYGAGLGRALAHARTAGAAPEPFQELVSRDDLLASLLVLHGLHPLPVDERVRRALAAARRELGIAEADLELVTVTSDRIQLRASAMLGGGAMAARVAEGAIRRVIESVAPEIANIEIHGASPPPSPKLVQLRVRREGA